MPDRLTRHLHGFVTVQTQHFAFDEYLLNPQSSLLLEPWIAESLVAWPESVQARPQFMDADFLQGDYSGDDFLGGDFLDGVWLIPLLLTFHKHNLLKDCQLQLDRLRPTARQEIIDLLLAKSWADFVGDQFMLRFEPGQLPTCARILMLLAEVGYFPTTTWMQQYVGRMPFASLTKEWFEIRPYTIRHPQLADLPMLLRVESECWIEPLRASEAELRQRLLTYPQGHCLLEMNDDLHQHRVTQNSSSQIVGVIYSQRIQKVESLLHTNFRDVAALHTPAGPIVQPLAVNVLPTMQQYGLGDQLLEVLLQLATVQPDVEWVAAVTLCKNYVHHAAELPMERYIHLKNERGQVLDPILHFHASHGAKIRQTIHAYRPPDLDNQGKGVLVEYDLRQRLTGHWQTMQQQQGQPLDSKSLVLQVEESVHSVLGKDRASAFAAQRPLMEMGFTSFELLELRTLLSQRLGVELDPTFFFRYSSVEAIVNYFQRGASSPHPTLNPSSNQHLTFHEITEDLVDSSSPLPPHPSSTQPIAIIGMACRFPGAVTNPNEFWSLLYDGVDAISEVPKSRWENDHYHGDQPGQIATRFGGFVGEVDGFDAGFFRIAPVEAKSMDPQQRLLLETHWEALENAGIAPDSLKGSATGIYVGIFSDDYKLLQAKYPEQLSTYFGTGTSGSVAAGRIAYFLGTQGATLAVDTACSSSLVAVHLACQSLQRGESNLALASGVNLILSPELSIAFSQANMLAPDGRCKTFDASANGYVRSEGCGVVVLKRLNEALADGDTILAVVRGSAINQDGASNGLTAPNGLA